MGFLEPGSVLTQRSVFAEDIISCMREISCYGSLLLSCFGGYCVSVSGFQAQQVMSPTSWLCLNNFSKIPAIALAYVFFGGYFSIATVHGMLISIICAYFYACATKEKTTNAMQVIGIVLALSSCIWMHRKLTPACEGSICLSLSKLVRVDTKHDIEPPSSWYEKPICFLWGVTTTIFEPSPAIVQFLEQNGTCLVVVGDQKTNHSSWYAFTNQHRGRGFYLSPTDQMRLPLTSIQHLPWNHFGRKNIGYLFVCRHGGRMIYDFDDDNTLRPHNTMFHDIIKGSLKEIPIVHTRHHLFNPYPAFAPVDKYSTRQFVWPRGFPLNFIHDPNTSIYHSINTVRADKIAIFQSLANNDPDVDAIFRMTRKLPIYFQLEDTIHAVPDGTYSPWNSQAVLVRDIAFWGLLLPISVTGRVSDIWRSYITSRMLFVTPYFVSFTSPFVDQYRNPHDYQVDLSDEQDLYLKTNKMLKILSEFSITKSLSLAENYICLVKKLHHNEIIGDADVKLAVAWVADLKTLKYAWPVVSQDIRTFTPPSGRVFDFRQGSLDKTNRRVVTQLRTHIDYAKNITYTDHFRETPKSECARCSRTAVCVTGQIRSLNLNPSSPTWPNQRLGIPQKWDFSMMKSGPTVAETIQKNLFSALGDFDVFMTISTKGGTREPKVGDMSACEPLRPRKSGSKLFCEVLPESKRPLYAEAAGGIWQRFYYSKRPDLQQGLLQQLYGMYQCSTNIKRQVISSGIQYDYIVRLRPDTWFHLPVPPIQSLLISKSVIKYSDYMYYSGGNEDWFGMGHVDAMLPYLDRYLALQEISADIPWMRSMKTWTAERFLREYLQHTYNITLETDKRIAAGIVKPTTRSNPSDA